MNTLIKIATTLAFTSTVMIAEPKSNSEEADIVIAELVHMIEHQTYYYGGLNYSLLKVDNTTRDTKVVGQAFSLFGGYKFHPLVSIEARYSSTLGDVRAHNRDNDWELSNTALYIKPQYAYKNVQAYVLLGIGSSAYDNGASHSETNIQWGLGASTELIDDVDFFIDYTKLYSGEGFDGIDQDHDFDMSSLNVGVSYRY